MTAPAKFDTAHLMTEDEAAAILRLSPRTLREG